MEEKKLDIAAAAKNLKTLKDVQEFVKLMTKDLVENMLEEELKQHLGYAKYAAEGKNSGNTRNGKSSKKVRSSVGEFELAIPRDRNGQFEPQLVKKHETDISEFDEMIISMYARGMTTRDIQAHVEEIYGAQISPALVSLITDKVITLAHKWQQRPLANVYVVIFFDALFYKVRENGKIISKAAYTCLGIDANGRKEILGLWIAENEGASYWLNIVNELKNRGVQDIFIACIDGLKGFDAAIKAVFPHTEIQRCVIHMMRNSFKYIPQKHRIEFVADLKSIYTAVSESEARHALRIVIEKWGELYPLATKSWFDHWDQISTYFKYPPEFRKMIYTTNAVEALHRQFRKVTKNRSILANDEALFKLLYLAARDIQKKWTQTVRDWPTIASQLHIIFKERLILS